MKIHHKRGEPIRQFSCTMISCHDSVMAEILGRQDPIRTTTILYQIGRFRRGEDSYFETMLQSGAKLKVGDKPSTFYIYSYSSDGHDGLAAIDELQTLDAVRLAANRVKSTYRGAFKLKLS